MLDTVLREEFAVLIAHEQILLVVLRVAADVGLLNAAPGRGVVAGDGEANHAAVVEANLLLHQTFSKGASANDGGAIVVLHGAGEYLGRRR